MTDVGGKIDIYAMMTFSVASHYDSMKEEKKILSASSLLKASIQMHFKEDFDIT